MNTQLIISNAQQAKLSGVLTHHVARDIEQQGLQALAQAKDSWQVDLSEVGLSSSVGVAIILSWLRAATAQDKQLKVINLPANMHEIIEFSGLQAVLANTVAA